MNTTHARALTIAAVLAKACRLDVVAFKPGNVSLWASGHAMHADDFLLSARVAAPALTAPGASVGARIEQAVGATRAAVGCNTNLGIVLLLAPLAAAACADHPRSLRARLATVLATLTQNDAAACYRAIRCAQPAGLGQVAEADVNDEPALDLRAAMRLAADRDRIAHEYVSDYSAVFSCGLRGLAADRQRWHSLAWATTACYLRLLAGAPDSHIVRKWGTAVATAVSARAQAVESVVKACENPRAVAPLLWAFDDELKSRGVNPGTSADLTVASVAVLLLLERLTLEQ